MNDIANEMLELLKKDYENEVSQNKTIQSILKKTKAGTADYADSLSFAKEIGKCVEKTFSNNINDDVLPDSKMYYDLAKALVEPMCKENYKAVAAHCVAVQTSLNKKANIGLRAVQPVYNAEKIEGIINYISSANKYTEREQSFLDSLSTNSKSIVDDSVKRNADFHYQSGLSPKIIRTTVGKTCKWCQEVAGVYDYKDVKNTGNDVFRRHANCDCTVTYDPGNGSKKVQDVWDKSWNEKSKLNIVQNRLIKINNETIINTPSGANDVTRIFLSESTPGKGTIKNANSVTIKGKTYQTNSINKIEHKNSEVEIAEWLKKTFGGKIYYLPVINEVSGVKSADYLWNNEFWDLKEISGNGKNTLYHAVEKKAEQASNFIFDISNSKLNNSELERQLGVIFTSKKMCWIDKIVIKKDESLLKVYKKKK